MVARASRQSIQAGQRPDGGAQLAHHGRPQAGLDLSLGHLSTTHAESRGFVSAGAVRWRVWVLLNDVWTMGPAMPEGAAITYARQHRFAQAFSFEAVPQST